jgi:hypothetical protein
MTPAPLRVGTRGSALALWQTEQVRARLTATGREPASGWRSAPPVTWCSRCRSPRSAPARSSPRQIDDALLEGRSISRCTPSRTCRPSCPRGWSLPPVAERDDPRDALIGRGPLVGATCPAEPPSRPAASPAGPAAPCPTRPHRGGHSGATWTPGWPSSTGTPTGPACSSLQPAGAARPRGRIGERLSPAVMLPAPARGARRDRADGR